MSIYIFCRPIRSGKTTELIKWCNGRENVAGIVMPDVDGSRKIFDLATKAIFDIEHTGAGYTGEPLISIGRFHFYSKAFDKANEILLGALEKYPRWLIIDEAGKLELEGKGFYPSIQQAIAWHDQQAGKANLLITVRENLCTVIIHHFRLHHYQFINNLEKLA